ncbi:MAG: RdgB/HAM1 family non-canonical purine NTP pyrophosphatase [Pyrinomonadaceae bacterium]|nr:RdgB/HAM1 family non-canonical purine NTP pyrophosphatase [Pyrinomonadaceae bacterium]
MQTTAKNILIATGNEGKLIEFKDLLSDSPFVVHSLKEFPNVEEVAETGETFAENAAIKARAYAKQTKVLTIADDSGLEVVALGNAPGVFSARYGGEGLKNEQRIEKLLSELEKTNDLHRKARFVCVVAIANSDGEILFRANGACEGTIAVKPRGYNGFGYDSIFIPNGFNETFGELSPQIKRKISHRALAMREIQMFFNNYLRETT